ncbi:MAG TPA: adenosine deaminase [Patescibacteria group bacterium]|nr:adenosine deaminase [Patescibacteria group bacterium]
MDTLELIRALPKAEQHIHIVGSTRPETLMWLAEESGQSADFETLEDVERFYQYTDFDHFISVYSTVNKYINDEGQFERITYEMLEDEARCNIRHVEASFSAPDHVRRGLDYALMLDAINRAIRRGRRELGVSCQIRVDLVRNYGPDAGMEVLNWIEEKGDNVVAVDIGGTERGFPPEPYASVYRRASEMGLHLVAHAGEAAGVDSVWGAVKALDVERIGHGVAARGNPELMDYLAERGVTIETCPVSNVRTGAISAVSEHPIREFMARGINVTVNSDDPSMFGTDMNNEYIQLHRQLGFTVDEIFQLSLNAVDSSFLREHEKQAMRGSFIKEYERRLT